MFQFVDRYSSTLASSYTSGGSSLSVSSATNLPSDGTCDFYLIVKAESSNTEEVFHVTSKSGTTLTVAGAQANTTASNHSSGAVVIATIMTKSGYTSMRADISGTGTKAAIPSSATAADQFWPSDGYSLYRYSGSAWVPWGPMHPFTEPTLQSFAWTNQGSATVTTTNGGIVLYVPGQASDNLRLREIAVPTAPYTVSIAFIPLFKAANFAACGLSLRDSGTGKIVDLAVAWDTGVTGNFAVQVTKWTNVTTFSAHYTNIPYLKLGPVVWLQINDNNTNRITSYSSDGVNWLQLHSVTRTDFITPDKIGFFCNNQNSADQYMTLLSWKQT